MPHFGQQYRFDTLFRDGFVGKAKKFGPILLYQIGELNCVSGYSVPEHTQWCHEISFVISGEGIFSTDKNTELLMEGGIQFSPAGSIHAIKTTSSDLRYGYIGYTFDETYQDEDISRLKTFFESTENYFVSGANGFYEMFFGAMDEMHNENADSYRMTSMYLLQMLITVYRSLSQQQHDSYFKRMPTDAMPRAVCLTYEYVQKHIYEKIVIQDMSKAIGYNYSYLSDAFKKHAGITINEYICKVKIQKSIELLKFENLSLTDVANKLNYSSVQSFNKVFKRVTGYSPSKFVEIHLKNNV